jgi:hypothetical protein
MHRRRERSIAFFNNLATPGAEQGLARESERIHNPTLTSIGFAEDWPWQKS